MMLKMISIAWRTPVRKYIAANQGRARHNSGCYDIRFMFHFHLIRFIMLFHGVLSFRSTMISGIMLFCAVVFAALRDHLCAALQAESEGRPCLQSIGVS